MNVNKIKVLKFEQNTETNHTNWYTWFREYAYLLKMVTWKRIYRHPNTGEEIEYSSLYPLSPRLPVYVRTEVRFIEYDWKTTMATAHLYDPKGEFSKWLYNSRLIRQNGIEI